jgi:16S rRNA (cytosine967-C5)-methyltransferase
LLASGAAEICDAGAQFAAHAVRPCPEARIVDIGAGRGNKTLLLEALAREAGGWADLVAVDSQAFKLDVLQRRASLSRLDGISTILADATALPGRTGLREGEADAVLLDAPCSGLGTLRRHPDKRWRLVPEDIERLAALDERLLRSASRLVRRGGFMVYSTCTLTKRENADVVSAFLGSSAGEGFSVDDLSSEVPETWLRFLGPEGWFQSIPEIDGFDGHFVARLRRG